MHIQKSWTCSHNEDKTRLHPCTGKHKLKYLNSSPCTVDDISLAAILCNSVASKVFFCMVLDGQHGVRNVNQQLLLAASRSFEGQNDEARWGTASHDVPSRSFYLQVLLASHQLCLRTARLGCAWICGISALGGEAQPGNLGLSMVSSPFLNTYAPQRSKISLFYLIQITLEHLTIKGFASRNASF